MVEILLLKKIDKEENIKNILESYDGIRYVIVDLALNTLEIEFDEKKLSINDIEIIVKKLGYDIINEKNRRCWSC